MSDSWLYRYKIKIIIGLVLLLTISMSAAMFVIISMTRTDLLKDSTENTRQLGTSIRVSMKQSMLDRTPEHIRETIRNIGRSEQVSKIVILDRSGTVAFSSDESEVGRTYDRGTDESCLGCHRGVTAVPDSTSIILHRKEGDVCRTVTAIYNEAPCFGCHPKENRVNGKLIIEHPLAATYALVNKIRIIILCSAAIGLLFIIPFMSRMINRYIDQIVQKNSEINLVYSIINSISKTIDMGELKNIVLDIVSDALDAHEVDLVLPNGQNGYRIVTRSATGEKLQRKKLDPELPLAVIVERWCHGLIRGEEFSPDRTEIYLPIEKGENRLALIVVRFKQRPFAEEKRNLIGAICTHIAIAFENARLYSIAITDELTGLFTVRHFRFCIDRQMMAFDRYGEKFSLLMIDIDNFKKVNDTYGHPVGDVVLKRVSHSIAESVRGSDMAFRYGGEEFVVILPTTALSGGLQAAERIRSRIEALQIDEEGCRIITTVSIGLAVCPDNAATIKDLLLEADKSLYAAKYGGKNRTVASEAVL